MHECYLSTYPNNTENHIPSFRGLSTIVCTQLFLNIRSWTTQDLLLLIEENNH